MRWLLLFAGLLLLLVSGLATTDDTRVWPVRNTLQYRAFREGGLAAGPPQGQPAGTFFGTVLAPDGEPIAGARVLLPARDGRTWHARTDADGAFRIEGIPVGRYYPVAGAPGFEDVRVGGAWGGVEIVAAFPTQDTIVLPPGRPRVAPPAANLTVGEPRTLSCDEPLASRAARREVRFTSGGRESQPTYLYTPITPTAALSLPTLLAVYPGPVAEWECVSVPLAQAGYAVLATGPAYSLDLERDVDELQQLVALARAGALPGADGSRVAALGGSYSALLVQRLLQRDATLAAAVLLGPPTDLFDMRRRFEQGTFVPPFGLDRALVALGFPDQEPLRDWRYSGAYHVRPDWPPVLLVHSRNDEIVPFQQSELLADALAEEGVEHALHLFDAASHYLLSGDEDALQIYDLTLDFLERHLTPEASPSSPTPP